MRAWLMGMVPKAHKAASSPPNHLRGGEKIKRVHQARHLVDVVLQAGRQPEPARRRSQKGVVAQLVVGREGNPVAVWM